MTVIERLIAIWKQGHHTRDAYAGNRNKWRYTMNNFFENFMAKERIINALLAEPKRKLSAKRIATLIKKYHADADEVWRLLKMDKRVTVSEKEAVAV